MATKTREILMAIRELNFKEMEQKAELDRQRAALELEFSRKRDSLITRIMSEKIEEQDDKYNLCRNKIRVFGYSTNDICQPVNHRTKVGKIIRRIR